jgi:hypothetical protein
VSQRVRPRSAFVTALVADDVLYLKTDEAMAAELAGRGSASGA